MEYDKIIDEQLNSMDLTELDKIMRDASEMSNGIFQSVSTSEIIDSFITGEPLIDMNQLIGSLADLLMIEVKASIVLGIEIIGVCIVVGLLNNLSSSFGNNATSGIGNIIASCVIIMLCINNLNMTYTYCTDTLNIMAGTMEVFLPVLIPLLISIGAYSSGSVLDPVIAGAVTGFTAILRNLILPLVFMSSIFVLINCLTEKPYVERLAKFLRRTSLFLTGFIVTVFSGITAIQGIMTKSADGLLVNTARYSVSNFVPIVGKFASDSIDMVLSCVGIIKNSIGLTGIIIILCLLSGPVLKMLSVAIIYKITSIIAEPVSTKQVSTTLNEMGSSIITMTVIMGLTALMFLIFLTIIISIGGGTLWK